jgi:hypothetical protein
MKIYANIESYLILFIIYFIYRHQEISNTNSNNK